MTAYAMLRTGGSGATAHYGTYPETYTIIASPIFSRMGITLMCADKTVFLPYANLMSLEWS